MRPSQDKLRPRQEETRLRQDERKREEHFAVVFPSDYHILNTKLNYDIIGNYMIKLLNSQLLSESRNKRGGYSKLKLHQEQHSRHKKMRAIKKSSKKTAAPSNLKIMISTPAGKRNIHDDPSTIFGHNKKS